MHRQTMTGSPFDTPARSQDGFEFDLAFSVDVDQALLVNANPMARRVLGLSATPIALDTVLHSADILMLTELHPEILSGATWTGTLRLRSTALGQRKLQAVVMFDLSAPDGRTLSIIATELTRPDQVLAELAHRATHDSLTGLPNRALLFDRLGLDLARARRNKRAVALLFIDLDQFKNINDTQGHEVGDRVLVDASNTMLLALRPTDTIARMGGDEFVVLCGEINTAADAELIASRIHQRLAHQINPATHHPVTASIGIGISHSGDIDAEALLATADRAMYDAKALGPGNISVRVIGEEQPEIVPPPGAEAVRTALFEGTLQIGSRAVVDLRSGVVGQVQVWPVWVGYTGTRYPATEFVDPEIHVELSQQLDTWSVQAARNTYEFFSQNCGDRVPRVTTKLSAATRLDSSLCFAIKELLAECTGSTWHAIGLEFGEAATAMASNASIEVLESLEGMGVALTVDDFGGGPLPLRWLARGSVRYAKLSPTLTAALTAARTRTAFAATVETANSAGMSAVATDITTSDQLLEALSLGCDGAQGPLFGADVPPAELLNLINSRYGMDFW